MTQNEAPDLELGPVAARPGPSLVSRHAPLPPEFDDEEQDELAPRRRPVKGWSPRGRMIPALLGAVLIATFLLLFLNAYSDRFQSLRHPKWVLSVYGAGVLFFGVAIMAMLRRFPSRTPYGEFPSLLAGALMGAIAAFLYLPGYGVLPDSPQFRAYAQVPLIFVVGATWGAWIGWQAYREKHPERGPLPCFSLLTLLMLVMGWGVLLWLFAPAPPAAPGEEGPAKTAPPGVDRSTG